MSKNDNANSIEEDDTDPSPTTSTTETEAQDENSPKPMSRLAMAAADWMEEEDDELLSYWDRFDDAKSNSKKNANTTHPQGASNSEVILENSQSEINMSTEERLDRYFQSRGIDKSIEKKYSKDIERAMTYASTSASSAQDAIQNLEKVLPYMQVGSKIGGSALMELAYAYQAHGDEEKAVKICSLIMNQNPLKELRLRAKQLMEDPVRFGKRYEKKSFWTSFDSWWN